MAAKVHIHIVTYNSERYIAKTLASLPLGGDVTLSVSDNHSSDRSLEIVQSFAEEYDDVKIIANKINLGFCAGQNQGAQIFLKSDANYLLVLNPDILLQADTLQYMIDGFKQDETVGAVTPLLLSTDENLEPIKPEIIDAAGMVLTQSIRHFDRYSGKALADVPMSLEYVFGGTGACLMLSRRFVEGVSFRGERYDADIGRVYPELVEGRDERPQLFDEAFFAFRDDADLALRAEKFGFRYLFTPHAVAYHKRYVHADKRRELPARINALGVRNRFLLQLNNMRPWQYPESIFAGFLLRNLLVLLGVFLFEQTSIGALKEVLQLSRRARERFRYVQAKV